MQKFVLTNVIHADIKSVYDVLCRPESYHSTIPSYYPSVRIMSVRDNTMITEEHIRLGNRELVIMAKHVSNPPQRHETFVIGGDAKRSHIIHTLVNGDDPNTKTSNNHTNQCTIVTTTIKFNRGRFALISNLRAAKSIEKSFKDMINDLAKIAESTT